MNRDEVLDNVCVYDYRSTQFEDATFCLASDEIPTPRNNCFCDNCFYGRDSLAVEILRLMEATK